MIDLNKCPFCGGEAVLQEDLLILWVECQDCGAQTGIQTSEAEAMTAWHRRDSFDQQRLFELGYENGLGDWMFKVCEAAERFAGFNKEKRALADALYIFKDDSE